MKNTYKIAILLTFMLLSAKLSFAQEQDTSAVKNPEDTITISTLEDTTLVNEKDPVKAQISAIIKEVNRRSELVDNIISSGDISVKVPAKGQQEAIDHVAAEVGRHITKSEPPIGRAIVGVRSERRL